MTKKETVVKLTLRLPETLKENVMYWAKQYGLSMNDYIVDAIERGIRFENKDYDLPSAEIARLNQLIDVITSLSTNVKSLENVTISGFDSLLGLTRGDNYLLEEDMEE